jgi:uncharacterized protein YndB with AHSA1/START domain
MTPASVSIEPVRKTVTVACTPEEAFRYFTADFSMWWPAASHSVTAYASEFRDTPAFVVLEPRIGGRIFERTRSGEEHLWGRLLAWEPPALVAFSFHPGRDEREAQRVDVTFSPVPEGARVVLIHSGWENLNANAQNARDSYNQGWEPVFGTAYRDYVLKSSEKSSSQNS